MNLLEAVQALKDGKNVRQKSWAEGEHISCIDGCFYHNKKGPWSFSFHLLKTISEDCWEEELITFEKVKANRSYLTWEDVPYKVVYKCDKYIVAECGEDVRIIESRFFYAYKFKRSV